LAPLGLPEIAEQHLMPKQVLFLCSGNYYRSRFAEHLFNWLAPHFELEWRADSRGLLVGQGGNIGPISGFAVDALTTIGIPLAGNHRDPEPLTRDDLKGSVHIVAVKEAEHRPVIVAQFPEFVDRVEYWDVDDLDCETAEEALPYLEQRVRDLISRLKADAARIPDIRRSAS
jgi:protein-tyrosine phosphatase